MAKQANPFWRVRNIIALFIQMGCELKVVEPCVDDDYGSVFGFSYLINPDTKAVVPILDLDDDEYVSVYEVESWERRLGVTIPRPPDSDVVSDL